MWTLILMGAATALIGMLPTYEAIGITAPILLVLLRILQGISAGGEWGGAVLMAVEHAPKTSRGVFGASPQIGVPLGLLLASGVMALMTVIAPGDAFLEWGWRVPFLLSVVLILVGYYVRRRVEESPVFAELAARKEKARMPIVQLFRKHALLVLIAALVFAGQQRRRLHDHRRLHPGLRDEPRGPDRSRARTGAVGGRRLGRDLAALDPRRPASSPTGSAAARPTSSAGSCSWSACSHCSRW